MANNKEAPEWEQSHQSLTPQSGVENNGNDPYLNPELLVPHFYGV